MSNNIPNPIKIYHIVHLDKLSSIINIGSLLCDEVISRQVPIGTTIGMTNIKERRLRNPIPSYPNLMVGQCVPFYFCPRSVMLYLIHMRNPELNYQDGQNSIVHLVANMQQTIDWAVQNQKRWVFTTSNAGASYFESYNDFTQLNQIDWNAVNATQWKDCKEGKQAEFLVECAFPWEIIEEIGVYSSSEQQQVQRIVNRATHIPQVNVHREWYY